MIRQLLYFNLGIVVCIHLIYLIFLIFLKKFIESLILFFTPVFYYILLTMNIWLIKSPVRNPAFIYGLFIFLTYTIMIFFNFHKRIKNLIYIISPLVITIMLYILYLIFKLNLYIILLIETNMIVFTTLPLFHYFLETNGKRKKGNIKRKKSDEYYLD